MSKHICKKCKGTRFKTVNKREGLYACRKCGTKVRDVKGG